MITILKKIYILLPLIVVILFFQNCGNYNKSSVDTRASANYEGVSNVNSLKLNK